MKNNKGFTLVEIIVVLVILAVLAATTIPSMLGFVNKAKDSALVAEARTAYVAAQAIATENAAMGKDETAIKAAISVADTGVLATAMTEYIGTDVTAADKNMLVDLNTTNPGKVDKVGYFDNKSNRGVIITAGVSTEPATYADFAAFKTAFGITTP